MAWIKYQKFFHLQENIFLRIFEKKNNKICVDAPSSTVRLTHANGA